MLPVPTPSEDDRKIQDNKYREILRDRELGWKITASHYIMTWQKHSGDKHNFSFVCASVYVCLGVGGAGGAYIPCRSCPGWGARRPWRWAGARWRPPSPPSWSCSTCPSGCSVRCSLAREKLSLLFRQKYFLVHRYSRPQLVVQAWNQVQIIKYK